MAEAGAFGDFHQEFLFGRVKFKMIQERSKELVGISFDGYRFISVSQAVDDFVGCDDRDDRCGHQD